jgi:VWFA-related protein
MRSVLVAVLLALSFAQPAAPLAVGQSGRGARRGGEKKVERAEPSPSSTPAPAATPAEEEAAPEPDDGEDAIKIDTNLVTVPVIVSDRGGRYVPDLKAEELAVAEDGAEQKVAFFAAVNAPFHVVLMLDTSASATVEKLRRVQAAAVAFVEQLQPADRVKVISFDDEVRELSGFTGDRAALADAIGATRPGKGTRLYDAFDRALRALGRVRGRKAVVLFTDGVDYRSDERSFDDNRRAVEESDVVVYPVRFDTREETERLAREQARGGQSVDLGGILGAKIPGLPGPVVVNRPGRGRDDDPRQRRPQGLPAPDPNRPDPRGPGAQGDSISSMLDTLYGIADDYLREMARVSGGRLVRADTPVELPGAFRQIADELRTQYSLGYYPSNAARDGKYRKIRVRTTRADLSVRARPGYRARRF